MAKMGKIISTQRNENGIVFNIELGPEEATMLQGHYDNVHVFSEDIAEFKTGISSRGKNYVTKYFLIPKKLRQRLDHQCPVNCQKIETDERVIFIYVVDKNNKTS